MIESLLLLLLLYLPVAFAGVSLHRRAPALFIAGALWAALLWNWSRSASNQAPNARLDRVALLWGAFTALGVFMLVPMPAPVSSWLGAPGAILDRSWPPIHPVPEKGFVALLTWGMAFAAYFAAREVCRTRGAVTRVIGLLMAVGAFEAVYGLVEWSGGRHQIFGFVKRAYVNVATGTFINRNHYADYLAMGLCLAVAVAADALDKTERRGRKREGLWDKAILIGFLLVLGMGAMLAAGSRAAPLCFLVAVGVIGLLFQRRYVPKRVWPALLILAVVFSVFLLWVGIEPLNPRYADLPREVRVGDARPRVYWTALKLWTQAPLIGSGLGSFADVFARVRPATVQAFYDHAHCDYLETLVETGLLGFALLYGGVAVSVRRIVRAVRDRSSRFARSRSLGALAAVLVIGLHGLVDFNLSIPANLVTAFTLLGLSEATAVHRLQEARR